MKLYNKMLTAITNWGDKAVLKEAESDHPDAVLAAAAIRRYRKSHPKGYNYVRYFKVETTQNLDGTPKMILKHKKSGGIVSNMLDIYNVIQEAHCRQGPLKVEKTLANCSPMFHSPTYKLCKLFIQDCFVCHEQHPNVAARKGAKKPILSSEFRDCVQVDLIDMRSMRKRDVYGRMQCWIMTIKDHSTGLVYLCSLLQKKAAYVASELEKYFGFIGYPEIFHTGVYTMHMLAVVTH
jgi:hypothetical protein